MIKPGTLCMIRGVPAGLMGDDCNGKIITVEGIKRDDIYFINPTLPSKYSFMNLDGCPEKYLWPFSDPDTLGLNTTDKTLETV